MTPSCDYVRVDRLLPIARSSRAFVCTVNIMYFSKIMKRGLDLNLGISLRSFLLKNIILNDLLESFYLLLKRTFTILQSSRPTNNKHYNPELLGKAISGENLNTISCCNYYIWA